MVTPPQSVRRILVAAALILGPILIALAFFHARAPEQSVGVYLEIPTKPEPTTFLVAGFAADPVSPADVSRNAVALPSGRIGSFVVVDPERASDGGPTSASLYLWAVDDANPSVRVDPVDVPSVVTRVNAHIYRVTPSDADLTRLSTTYRRSALRQAASSRTTMSVVLAVVLTDAAGHRRMHAVRLGGAE